jgi:ABC-type lipoprotein release transport system permease subunit
VPVCWARFFTKVPERDLPTFGAVLRVTLAVALWASDRPARRALALDPVTAIQDD